MNPVNTPSLTPYNTYFSSGNDPEFNSGEMKDMLQNISKDNDRWTRNTAAQ